MPDSTVPTGHGHAAINRANSQHSTGPRTRAGKLSSLNALTHGLTGGTLILASEDAAALLEMHNVKGIRYDPAEDGFVFSLSHHPHPHHLPPTTYHPPSERPKTPFRVILKVATSAGIAT